MNILIICNIVIIIASNSHKSNKYWTNVQIMSIMREILLYQIMINLASAGFQLRGSPPIQAQADKLCKGTAHILLWNYQILAKFPSSLKLSWKRRANLRRASDGGRNWPVTQLMSSPPTSRPRPRRGSVLVKRQLTTDFVLPAAAAWPSVIHDQAAAAAAARPRDDC